jgi:RHS repeat-associated protein
MRGEHRPSGVNTPMPWIVLVVAVVVSLLGFGLVFDASANDRPTAPAPAPGQAPATGKGAVGPELTGRRTRNSKTFTAPGGRGMVTRVYPGAVHFKDAHGKWAQIDDTVEQAGGKLRNRRNRYQLELPDRLAGQQVKIGEGGDWLSFGLNGAGGAPAAPKNNAATFADALPGVDVKYAAQPSSVKEELVLAGPDSPADFSFDVAGSDGLSARKTDEGGVEFKNAQGDVAFTLPAPFMYDANQKDRQTSNKVSYDIERSAGGWTLKVHADRDWLQAKDRQFPVTVDPTVYFDTAGRDCVIDQGAVNTNWCDLTYITAGKDYGYDHRALLDFDVAGNIPKDAVVLNARMGLYASYNNTANSKNLGVYRMTRAWQEGATWNTKDGTNAWTTPGGEFDSSKVAETQVGTSTGWKNWYVTKLVQDWVDGTSPDYGLMLKDSDPSPVDNEISFYASEDSWAGGHPCLEVRWEPRVGEGSAYTYNGESLNDRTSYKVNVANGNLDLVSNDINLAGTQLDLAFTRHYNSGWGVTGGGQFGGGTTANMGKDVWLDSSDSPDLTKMVYPGTGSAFPFFKKSGSYDWDQPANLGMNADLKENIPNDTMELTYRGSDLKYVFDSSATTGGGLTEIRDKNGQHIDFNYDASGNMTSMVDTQGRTLGVTVNGDGFVTQIQDPTGRLWKYQYGTGVEYNLIKKYTDPEGRETLYDWDGNQNLLLKVTTPGGRQTKFGYDSSKRLASVIRVDNTVAQTGPTTSYAYYTGGGVCASDQNRTVVTDPRGKQTTYCSAQKDDRVAKVVDAKGHEQSKQYTTFGNVQQLTRPGTPTNSVSALNWDSSTNNLTGGTSPTGGQFSVGYTPGATGQQKFWPASYTNPQGGKTELEYDNGTTGGPGNVTMVGSKDENGNLQPEKAKLTYNSDGTIDTASDGRDSAGFDTTWDYNYTNGNLTTIDPPGTAIGNTTITYDGLSRIATITDGKGQEREFVYDKLDRVTSVTLKNSAGAVLATETASYDYDGNMTTRVDVEGTTKTTTSEFDALNRLKKETLPGAKTNEYTYDATGNVLSVKTNATDTVSYSYDDVNLVSKLSEPPDTTGGVAPETVFSYDTRNNRTQTLYPNGVQVDQTYLGDDAVKTIEAKKGATTLRKFTYDYVKGARNTDLRQSVVDKDSNKTTYTYDPLDRLKRAETRTSGNALVDDYQYDYDAASNRTKQTVQIGAGTPAVTTYAYNQLSQLCWKVGGTSSADCSTTPTGATTYAYDANGNQTTGGYGYNVKDQTTSINGTALTYLGLNQNELTGIGSDTFQNNGMGVAEQTSGSNTYRFRRDPSGTLLSTKQPGGRYYYIQDALGSTVALTDSSGAVANSYKYDPYGALAGSSGTVPNPFKFAGGHDTGQGVYHFGARQYDPALARWTSADPLDQIGDLQQANRYSYAGADPVNFTDPSGCTRAAYNSCVRQCQRFQFLERSHKCEHFLKYPVVGLRLYFACLSAAGINSYFWCRKACRGVLYYGS